MSRNYKRDTGKKSDPRLQTADQRQTHRKGHEKIRHGLTRIYLLPQKGTKYFTTEGTENTERKINHRFHGFTQIKKDSRPNPPAADRHKTNDKYSPPRTQIIFRHFSKTKN
jgi:hypothetical protein